MQLTDEQRSEVTERIASYEQQRDQSLAEANKYQGAALALRDLLAASAASVEPPSAPPPSAG